MSARSQRGFTLIEMMIVIAIIAVLTALVTVTVMSKPKPVDVAGELANLVQAGSRTAVRLGPVRDDIVAALGGMKRRARLTASAGPHPLFTLEVLVEDPTPAWETVDTYQVPSSVTLDGFANIVADYTTASPLLSTNWSAFEIGFEPTGSSSSVTVFVSSTQGSSRARYARMSVLPLGTATFVRSSWE